MARRSRSSSSTANRDLDPRLWGIIRTLAALLAIAVLALVNLLFYPAFSGMTGFGFRYVCLSPVVLVVLTLLTTQFIQNGYRLKHFRQAFRYLTAAMSSFGYPTIEISEGEKQLEEDEENLMEIVGGPGYLVVQPGNVVLLENLDGRLRVLRTGLQYVSRSETIKVIQTLDEQNAKIEDTFTFTRDGFDVTVKDVNYRYRLRRDRADVVSSITDERYAFSDQTVYDMAYNRTQTPMGVAAWHVGINFNVDSGITEYIAKHTIDELTAPIVYDREPRAEINKAIFTGDTIPHSLRIRGGELLWIDIGHFSIHKEEVSLQRVNTWQARWITDASITRAIGDAKRLAYQEMGYADAQAEMLMSITQAFKDFQGQGISPQHLRAIYLARFAQLLDAMGKQYLITGGENS